MVHIVEVVSSRRNDLQMVSGEEEREIRFIRQFDIRFIIPDEILLLDVAEMRGSVLRFRGGRKRERHSARRKKILSPRSLFTRGYFWRHVRNRYVTRYPRPYVVQARYAEQFTIAAPRPAFSSSGAHVCTHTWRSALGAGTCGRTRRNAAAR